MLVRRRRGWEIAEATATPEDVYLSRRTFVAGIGASIALAACGGSERSVPDGILATLPTAKPPYPFKRNLKYAVDRPLTDEVVAATYNNFYEFTSEKDGVWKRAASFRLDPWSIDIGGMVAKPMTFSLDDLMRAMPVEERVYRHRCVEAWSMAVPWTGFPLARLLEKAEPEHGARFVRFVSVADSVQQPGVREQAWYPWPYHEGLSIAEAMNELTMVITGIYGHALPKQHGAPIRIVTPWKYGYKSPKSVVRIELVDKQPGTFWQDLAPNEYPFQSNVNPAVPHPRWSQASERLIGTWSVKKTLPFNGYGDYVQHLY